MSSENFDIANSLLSLKKTKYTNKSDVLESGRRCIASAIAKIVNRMVNKDLQARCKELLEMDDLAETEARILFILQQIDIEIEEENSKKDKKRTTKRLKKKDDLKNNSNSSLIPLLK